MTAIECVATMLSAAVELFSIFTNSAVSNIPELCDKNISIYCTESQDLITQEPSYSVTWAEGTYTDPETGIRKNSQGDYLCAMGTEFGQVGDRFFIGCKDGQTYTVQIGDSKGDKWYDIYGNPDDPALASISGYCVIEFIVDMEIAIQHLKLSGSYHTTGLIPTDIQYIIPLTSHSSYSNLENI